MHQDPDQRLSPEDAGSSSAAGKTPVRIGVVDDHPLVGDGLRALLEREEQRFCVAASAPTVAQLKDELQTPPAAVLLDIRLADSSTPTLNTQSLIAWGTRVLIYTQGDQHEEILRAMQAGASGVVHKQDPVEELLEALETVTTDEFRITESGGERQPGQHVSQRLAQALEILVNRAPQANLTPQELEVVRLYASGMAGRHVAKAMHLSEATVKTYLRRAKDKLIQEGFEAATKHDIRTAAIKLGIVPPVK